MPTHNPSPPENIDQHSAIAEIFTRADRAHAAWQIEGSGYWACSDQFVNGIAKGSRWYPRVITTALWLTGAGAVERQESAISTASVRSKGVRTG